MGTTPVFLLVLGLAIPILVSCNREGDILHLQKTLWSDPNMVLDTWNWDPTLPSPCSWLHIVCNNEDAVIRVILASSRLSGPLTAELGLLTYLESLDLADNNLSGSIPGSLANIKNIKMVNLADNNFSGPIPSSFADNKNINLVTTGNPMLCADGQSCQTISTRNSPETSRSPQESSAKKKKNIVLGLTFGLMILCCFVATAEWKKRIQRANSTHLG